MPKDTHIIRYDALAKRQGGSLQKNLDRFDSCTCLQFSLLGGAVVDRDAHNVKVVGSIPTPASFSLQTRVTVTRHPHKVKLPRSIPGFCIQFRLIV